MKEMLFWMLVLASMTFAVALYISQENVRDLEYQNAVLINRLVVAEREYGKVERLAQKWAARGGK